MTDKTKYQLLQASSDDHNDSHQLDLLDLSPPDYEQSNKLNLPLINPPRAMPRRAMASLPSTRSRLASLSESRKRVFFAVVTLCTIFDIAILFLMLFASSEWDTRSAWHLTALFTPLIQTIVNFLYFIECRAYDDLRKLSDLENGNQENANQENANQENANQENANQENANQENANQENANQKNANQENTNQKNNKNPIYFWPLWMYSGPLLLIMMIMFALRAPITKIIAVSAYLALNLVFILTVSFRSDQENTNKDFFNLGLAGNTLLSVIAMMLLMGGIAEGFSTPTASALGVSLGA